MSTASLSISATHTFSKTPVSSLTLLPGIGIKGDCHAGTTVQHRSRMHIVPPPANLRQVHLIAQETLDELGVGPGEIGENITTVGVDLLGLGRGAKLHFLRTAHANGGSTSGEDGNGEGREGDEGCGNVKRGEGDTKGAVRGELDGDHPIVVVRGLRNPCPQIDKFRTGLKEGFVERDMEGKVVKRRAGVMGTVERGGVVEVGMRVVVEGGEGGLEVV
ncbi:hypothetical protein OQA88_4296 [Cercophora sp. LCS_1]